MSLIGPHGTPARLIASSQCALGFSLVIAPIRSFSARRFFERRPPVA
jgi:hypothetical protein